MKGRKTQRRRSSHTTNAFVFLALAAFVVVFVFAAGASAMTETAATTPSIASDQPDYAPGDTVTLTGANW